MEKSLCEVLCRTCSMNKGISVWSVSSMWGKSQSKETCDFYHATHVMTISLTISFDYLQI